MESDVSGYMDHLFFINFIVGMEVLVMRILCLLVPFMFCSDMMAQSLI